MYLLTIISVQTSKIIPNISPFYVVIPSFGIILKVVSFSDLPTSTAVLVVDKVWYCILLLSVTPTCRCHRLGCIIISYNYWTISVNLMRTISLLIFLLSEYTIQYSPTTLYALFPKSWRWSKRCMLLSQNTFFSILRTTVKQIQITYHHYLLKCSFCITYYISKMWLSDVQSF